MRLPRHDMIQSIAFHVTEHVMELDGKVGFAIAMARRLMALVVVFTTGFEGVIVILQSGIVVVGGGGGGILHSCKTRSSSPALMLALRSSRERRRHDDGENKSIEGFRVVLGCFGLPKREQGRETWEGVAL